MSGRRPKHPEAKLAELAARTAKRNAEIREKTASNGFGFGWVVLMLRAFGLGSTAYHRDTYAEVKAIADKEIHNKDYVRGALIIKKTYNHEMMLGGNASRVSERDMYAVRALHDDGG